MRRGLTLIELLITIVIMVTVLAAVLPLVSPNNDSKKITEASRQLSSLIAHAKAKAQSEGRPYGVGFTESGASSPFSGMATDIYLVAEPAPFAGMSTESQVRFYTDNGVITQLEFVGAGSLNAAAGSGRRNIPTDPWYDGSLPTTEGIKSDIAYFTDPVPPGMFRRGDIVEVRGCRFTITDPDRDGDGTADEDFKSGEQYDTDSSNPRARFTVAADPHYLPRAQLLPNPLPTIPSWVQTFEQMVSIYGWSNPTTYTVKRRPMKTSDEPIQLPRGIGVDLQASCADRVSLPTFNFDTIGPTNVVIMFSPTGALDGLYIDGEEYPGITDLYLSIGLMENGNGSGSSDIYDFIATPPADESDLMSRRQKLNWLNPDARWVAINPNSGRVQSAAVPIFNVLEDVDLNGNDIPLAADWRDQVTRSRQGIGDR